MTKTMKMMTAAMMLTVMTTACDYAERKDLRNERSDSVYRAAMEDFRAGRIDAAVKGFEAAIRKDPANSSARFQLACVLQDVKHDYLGAFCCYREYLMQQPDSDKAKLAADRLASCEKELAMVLATKHGLGKGENFEKELETLRGKLKTVEAGAAASEKELAKVRAKVEAMTAERSRLMAIIKDTTPESVVASVPSIKEAKDLLDEEEEEITDRIKMSRDAAALRIEEKAETDSVAALIPTHTAEDVAKRDADKAARDAEKELEREARQAKVESRPKTYVVQEGDTLYKVAKQFYGRISAWKKIRDANKELIPMDNRLRAGDEIKLP